jgi:1,2-diacylglycerol 3-beta-galactosyltransferase
MFVTVLFPSAIRGHVVRKSCRMTDVSLFYFDAGGGHRAAAAALAPVLEERGWRVRRVNLQELLDPIDIVRKATGLRLQDFYNLLLKKGWTWGTPATVRVLQRAVRFYHRRQVRLLEPHWRETRPELVVSLVPHFNRAIFESLQLALPGTPLVTILTDIADYPPHFWLERQEQFFICGSGRAVEQARALGLRDDQVFRVSGMILHPRFYAPVAADRRAERVKLGLDPDLPTGLVLYGGHGSNTMHEIARALDRSRLRVQLLLLCGRNEALAAKLRARRSRLPCRVEGFTSEIPYWMHLADFFIGKPGPGSVSEALQMKLPVLVERNARTLPQERYNAAWAVDAGLGLKFSSGRRIARVVARLLEPGRFEQFRSNVAALENRAIFEIPPILESILQRHRLAASATSDSKPGDPRLASQNPS